MSESVATRLRLSLDSKKYIKEFAEKNNIPHDNQTINKIIEEHKQIKTNEETEKLLIEKISGSVSKEIKKELRRILLGTNNTDRNTQIIIELLNGIMINNNIEDIISTNDLESKSLLTARNTVQNNIENLQQKRAEYYQEGGK